MLKVNCTVAVKSSYVYVMSFLCWLKLPLKSLYYTPSIYAEGYIVFVFPFIRSYVHSFIIASRSWNYFKALR